jgi:hypothetical protein
MRMSIAPRSVGSVCRLPSHSIMRVKRRRLLSMGLVLCEPKPKVFHFFHKSRNFVNVNEFLV